MANEIQLTYEVASSTAIYCVIRNPSSLTVWDGSEMSTWSAANLSTYAVALTDAGGDVYAADAPATLPSGSYKLVFYEKAGASPAVGDIVLDTKSWTYAPDAVAAVSVSTSVAGRIKLDAVNEMLNDSGLASVISLDTGGNTPAAQAEQVLDRVDRDIQGQGWYANSEYNVTLTPDVSGIISLGYDTLQIDHWVSGRPPFGVPGDKQVTRRGDRLYDLENRTDVFTDSITVRRVRYLPFVDLPPALKGYITTAASVEFQRVVRASRVVDAFLEQKFAFRRIEAYKENSDNSNPNTLNNPVAREITGRGYGVMSR